MTRGRKTLARLGLAAGVLVLGLGAAELILRASGFAATPARWYDPGVGWRFHAGQRREMRAVDGMRLADMTTNALGWRGPEPLDPRPAGQARIACLGDSWTFGWAVEDEESYPALLARALEGRAEVLNFGMPGFNAEDEHATYTRLVRPLRPDVVLLGVFLNDLEPRAQGVARTDTVLYRLLGRSALLEALNRTRAGRVLFPTLAPPAGAPDARVFRKSVLKIYDRPESELARPFVEPCLAALDALTGDVTGDGAHLLVVLFPARYQVQSIRSAVAAGEPRADAIARSARVQALFAGVASRHAAPVLDLLPDFLDFEGDPYHALARDHPGAAGYALIARRVGEELERLGWL